MGRKGSCYTIKKKLFYIGLVVKGLTPNAIIQRQGEIAHSQVSQWVKNYRLQESMAYGINLWGNIHVI